MKNIIRLLGCLVTVSLLWSADADAATLNDYCVVPPFIQEIAKPNLLMIVDNSASMNDLAYDDKGYKRCSTTTSKTCAVTADCPSLETCTTQRNPYYCFDETFSTANSYVGYFDPAKNYQFDFSTNRFQEYAGTIPTNCAMAAVADQVFCKQLSGTLHLNIDKTDPTRTKYFYASGKYLNWLTSSKFDVEKEVLTGGKYVTKVCSINPDRSCLVDADCGGGTCGAVSAFLQSESRGCVGMGYIKDANISNFVNYATGEANPNTSMELSFLVRGPSNPYNTVAPSTGGQTYLEIFSKAGTTYDYGLCQKAIDSIATGGNADIKKDVTACLASTGTPSGRCQGKLTLSCAAAADCVSPVTVAHCAGDATMTACTAANEATYCKTAAGSSTCTEGKVGQVCTAKAECDIKACSLDTNRICSSDPDCKIEAVGKRCSHDSTISCNNDGQCNPPKSSTNTCLAAVPAKDYGICSAIKTNGTCTSSGGGTYIGPCIPAGGGDFSPCVTSAAEALNATKIDFMQNMQACWSMRNGNPIGGDDILTVIKRCPEMYASIKTCQGDGYRLCSAGTDCVSGVCLTGPAAIQPGNPGLLCAPAYEGKFFELSGSNWVLKAGYSKTSPEMLDTHTQFCNDMNTPVVTDPTNPPTTVTTTENIPAILSGLSLAAQLGSPILSVPVRVETAAPPSGLVQEYAEKIRIGLMAFNTYGSASETSTTSPLPAGKLLPTKVCSNDANKTCTQTIDCGPGNACGNAADIDGAKVLNLIGKGRCFTEAGTGTGTPCTKQAHCTAANESCVSDGVGDHVTTGLVNSIDRLRAATWTPFAEAYYNAIGYFAMDSSDSTGKKSRYDDLRLNSGDYPDAMNPSEYVCQANNILLVTDGSSAADQNSAKTSLVDAYKSLSGNVTGNCTKYAGSQDLDDLAWIARQRDINSFSPSTASTALPQKKNQSIATYVVFNGSDNGESNDCNNTTLLAKTANNGGTELLRTEIPEQYEAALRKAFEAVAGGTASGTAASILSNSEGSGANILQAVFYPSKEFGTETGETSPTSAAWIGELQNLWYFVDPFIGNSSVREDTPTMDNSLHIVNDFAVEFQFKGGETIAALKKDTNGDGSGDLIITTAMDSRVKNQGYCTNGTDLAISSNNKCVTTASCLTDETCVIQGIVNADDVSSLWRAGRKLWNRDLSASPRKLYTHLYGTSVTAPAFCGTGALTFSQNAMVDLVQLKYLNSSNVWTALSANDKCVIVALLQADSIAEAGAILQFTHGYDPPTVGNINGEVPRDRLAKIGGSTKVWKLGDIIASTPRIQSFNKLNNYQLDPPAGYGDTTYANDSALTGYANSTEYKSRGMAYAGANDGMLHAFKLGLLTVTGSGSVKASLADDPANSVGKEEWAFIPKHVLPYLRYLAARAYDTGSHIYLVDGPTRLIDASIGYDEYVPIPTASDGGCNATDKKYWACKRDSATTGNKSWRSILIGSMGIGGASAAPGSTCDESNPCVPLPIDGVGYSSYFALDITDPTNPQYLWSFSDAELGAATSGAAVARIGYKFTDGTNIYGKEGSNPSNGRWFAVIGNGPTGPIDTTYHQFKGKSSNPLQLFVLDLKTGALVKKISSSISNAFAGSMPMAPIDTDRTKRIDDGFYADDALYFGYSQCTSNCTSAIDKPVWDGGIMRLLTDEKFDVPTDGDPTNDVDNWTLSTLVSGIGPVTTAVNKLQDRKNHKLWLYTGSGRYFFKGDDSTVPGKILAIKDPCYDSVNDDIYKASVIDAQSPKCTAPYTFSAGDFANQTSSINTDVDTKKGWFINQTAEDTTNDFGAERIITEPVVMPNGGVFFTSFMPSTDICNYGGKSFMWGMNYSTGGAASGSQLNGKALIQVSTGSFEEVDLSTAFSGDPLKRKMTTPMVGKPPTDPPPIVSGAGNKPLKRILHIREK